MASTNGASADRVVPGSFNLPPAAWPPSAITDTSAIDPDSIAHHLVFALNETLSEPDPDAAVEFFLPDPNHDGGDDQESSAATAFWRDHLVVSWDLRTLKGRDKIRQFLAGPGKVRGRVRLVVDDSSAVRRPRVADFRPGGGVTGVQFFVEVECMVGVGRGLVRLVEVEQGAWKIWTLFTTLEELHGARPKIGPRREMRVQTNGGMAGRNTRRDRRREEADFAGMEPEVLIIGAGQAGLTAAARLKMLGVSALVIDKNKRVGDNWRNRYKQLVLHDPVWYDHMPYVPFPDGWPVFTPKDKLADWLELYAEELDLNVWTHCVLRRPSWDENRKNWTVTIVRVGNGYETLEERTFRVSHIIIATGHSGMPNMPPVSRVIGAEPEVFCHSRDFPGARSTSTNRKAIVVGACNSAIDICQDYVEKGYDVTLIQRSSTYVISSDSVLKISLAGLYEEGGPPTEDSDICVWSLPSEVLKSVQVELTRMAAEKDRHMLEGLENAGFMTDRGPHGAGLFGKYLQRGGGYYIDVGGAELIADGKIKVRHAEGILEATRRGLKLADGTELEADEVVFATGYRNMRTAAQFVLGGQLPANVGDVWGWDEEGEMRTIWKGSGHPGLWFHGGNLAMCRYYSRLVALQIKASLADMLER
ncbi:hypothetical protein VTK26DRAFT_2706 [Humicola hyalothermophila]